MEEIQGAHRRVIEHLREEGFDFSTASALDLFAREGSWHSKEYADLISDYEAWEVEPKYIEGLKRNLPNSLVRNTDSFMEIRSTPNKYSLILCDNPQSVYGYEKQYCEHFELFPHIFRAMKDAAILLINVNHEPYNLHAGDLWWKKRIEFYGTQDPSRMSQEEFTKHYQNLSEIHGYTLSHSQFEPLNSFISVMVLWLRRK